MIRIMITAAAFDAIAKTLPLGSVAFEAPLTRLLPPRRDGVEVPRERRPRGAPAF
jgi:hypothetical protein